MTDRSQSRHRRPHGGVLGPFGLGWREMRRRKGRFGLLVLAEGLLAFLVVFQQTLGAALLDSFTGALAHQSGAVVVLSDDARRSLEASTLTDTETAAIGDVPGVADLGRIGEAAFTLQVRRRPLDAVLWGYQPDHPGGPTRVSQGRLPRRDGEAAVSAGDADAGLTVGAVVRTAPGNIQLQIVGVAPDSGFSGLPVLFVPWSTFVAARRAANPTAGVVPASAVALQPADELPAPVVAERINHQVPNVVALPRDAAVRAQPGTRPLRVSIALLLALAFGALTAVVGLFFLIVTAQKRPVLGLARAMGASPPQLAAVLVFQVLAVTTAGLLVALVLARGAVEGMGSVLPVELQPRSVAIASGAVLGVSLLASGAALGQMVRVRAVPPVDPGAPR